MKNLRCSILELLSLKRFNKQDLLIALQIPEVELEMCLANLLSENRIIDTRDAFEITGNGKMFLETCFNSR